MKRLNWMVASALVLALPILGLRTSYSEIGEGTMCPYLDPTASGNAEPNNVFICAAAFGYMPNSEAISWIAAYGYIPGFEYTQHVNNFYHPYTGLLCSFYKYWNAEGSHYIEMHHCNMSS